MDYSTSDYIFNQDNIKDLNSYELVINSKNTSTFSTFNLNTLDHGVLDKFSSVELFYNSELGLPYMVLDVYDSNGNVTRQKRFINEKLAAICNPPKYVPQSDGRNVYMKEYVLMKNELANKLIFGGGKLGYEYPTSVQKITIPSIIMGKDVICQAFSGTGKTHAFVFGLLWHLNPNVQEPQILIVTNTHEVARQIYQHIVDICPEEYTHKLCIGGQMHTNIVEENKEISRTHIIVGTMGKIHDLTTKMFRSKHIINPKKLSAIAIDEFDVIMSNNRNNKNMITGEKSTSEQLETIIASLNPELTMRVFFSATITEPTKIMAYKYFRNYSHDVGEPLLCFLEETNQTLCGIKQYYVNIDDNDYRLKMEIFEDIYLSCTISQAILFVNKKETAERLYRDLDTRISRKIYHGNLEKNDRRDTIEAMRKSEVRLLISSDLGSRGLDLNGISVVFNFDVPQNIETYIHRIGRSGRQERKGVAITLITKSEYDFIEMVSKKSKYPMQELPSEITKIFN